MEKIGRVVVLLLLIGTLSTNLFAQRINFSTWSGSDDITITSVGASSLNFNDKVKVIKAGMGAIVIEKLDEQQNLMAIFEITAPTEFDITVELDHLGFLAKDGVSQGGTIPLTLNMAYTNNGQGNSNQVPNVRSAQDVPAGFNSVTFPVSRRGGGAPLPPTPEYGNYSRPKSNVYLYIYGTLGPIGIVPAGDYTATVNLNVYVAGGQN